jgi:hypothetical protein
MTWMKGVGLRGLASLAAIAAAAAMDGGAARAADTRMRPERVKIDREFSADRAVRGRLSFQVPADWTATRHVGHSRAFVGQVPATGCQLSVLVEPTVVATRGSAAAQIAHRLRAGHRVAAMGRGPRPHGRWGVDEVRVGAAGSRRAVYGIGVVLVAARVFVHIRVLAMLDMPDHQTPCSDDDTRNGVLADTVTRIVRGATLQARIITARD